MEKQVNDYSPVLINFFPRKLKAKLKAEAEKLGKNGYIQHVLDILEDHFKK